MARTRLRVCAVLVLAVVAIATLALPAGADVEPDGKISIKVQITNKLSIFDTPTSLVTNGTFEATMAKDGKFTIPKANIKLSPVEDLTFLDGGVHVTQIAFGATADWKGGVDPETGLVTISAPTVFTTSGDKPVPVPGCPIKVQLNLSTKKAGGKAYDDKTGKATLSANDYTIPPLPFDLNKPSVPGCGHIEQVFNGALDLPIEKGEATTSAAITFTPIVTGTGDTTPVTQAEPSTTTAPPTTVAPTTAVPVTVAPAATGELPRTGSSTLPLALAGGGCVAAGLALVARRRRVA
jgi:LPXTG-motif cell wall-anchored protein